jgi:hypothetical protein
VSIHGAAPLSLRPAVEPAQRGLLLLRDYEPANPGQFLIDGLLASTTTLLTGSPEAGKTTLALHMVRALLTSDGRVLDRPTDGRDHTIAWIGTDPGWSAELKDAYPDAGDRFYVLPPSDHAMHAYEQADWATLREELEANAVTLVVLDNLFGLLGPRDSVKANEVAEVLGELTAISDRGIAVLVLHHSPLGGNGRPSGNTYIAGWARHRLELVKNPGKPHVLNVIGNRVPEAPALRLELSPDTCQMAPIAEATNHQVSRSTRKTKRKALSDKVLHAIENAPAENRGSMAALARYVIQSVPKLTQGAAEKRVQRMLTDGQLVREPDGLIRSAPQ